MNKELKQRIEQINAGTAPAGYKKTKVGIVPEEWEVQRIKNYVKLVERPIKLEDDVEYELVTVRRAFGGVDSRGKYLGETILVKNYFELHKNDFVISKRQIAHGACGVVPPNLSGAVVSNEYNVFEAQDNTDIVFFNMLMQHPYYKRLFYLMSDGVHIEKLLFKTKDWMKRAIALPPLPEQQKIAEILTAQDSLISLLQKRIELKQQQKQGLIENLVTGKVRLFGFSGQWDKVPLRNILRERKTFSQKGFEYPHVTLSTEGIYPKTERFNRDHLVKSEEKEYKITLYNDICYNPANLKFGVICRNTFGSAIFSPIYVTFEVVNGHNVDFIAHYLMRWNFINAVRKYEEGTVYERMAVKPDDFLKFKIPLPPRPEQDKIAEILSAQDNIR